MAGAIEVDTQPGEFTEIRIVLPRTPAFALKTCSVSLPDVRYWHKADIGLCTAHVRFWGLSGHDQLHRTCPLMTQSGHRPWAGATLLDQVDARRTSHA